MTGRPTRLEWLLFLALGLMWGSSYLFIKIAVPDFGTFTLVALRLAIGAAFLWLVIRAAGQELPRERRIYGHLLVMAVINIVIPFALITWAERSVDSSIAAILTSAVPLFAIVIAPLFLPDEPIRVNGEFGLLGAALSYAVGAVYSRRNMRGVRPMIPAVFQVTFAMLIAGTIALVTEHPWDARPGIDSVFAIVWLGILGSGLAYLVSFRLLASWGATSTTLVAYVIPV